MLGKLTDSLPDAALFRLADPTAKWTTEHVWKDGARCWEGHAGDWRDDYVFHDSETTQRLRESHGYARYFDRLCDRFTLARVVRAIRLRAERELARRGLVPHEAVPATEEART